MKYVTLKLFHIRKVIQSDKKFCLQRHIVAYTLKTT